MDTQLVTETYISHKFSSVS